MADWSIARDRKSARMVARRFTQLPTSQIKAGIARVNKRALTAVRKETVNIITARLPLKRKFFIGKPAQRRLSGIKTKNGGGVFWIVARDLLLHRLGAVRAQRGGRGAIVQRGRALTKSISEPRGIVIGRRLLVRSRGKLVPATLLSQTVIRRAFYRATRAARIDLKDDINRELQFRLDRYLGKIRRA